MTFLVDLGSWVINLISGTGAAFLLLFDLILSLPKSFKRIKLIMKQVYSSGVMSLPIILVSGFFVGMVLAFQGYTTLVQFGAETALGTMVSLSILRELGPVVTALLFAGRAGSAITSEIGLMKATEQISSMEMMAVRPVEYVYLPRFIGVIISLPLLAILFSSVAIIGGYLIGVIQLGVDSSSYWGGMQDSVSFFRDIIQGVIVKSFVFSIIAAFISVYQGYNCHPTSEGIGRATTKTVVITSLLILSSDFLLTAIFFGVN